MCHAPRIHHPVDEATLLQRQYRSMSEYVVGDSEEVDAIIQAVTQPAAYQPRPGLAWNGPVLRFDDAVSDPVRQSLRTPFPLQSKTSLGRMNLPVEILCEVVRRLDMRTLLKFRQVDQRAREIVSAVIEYRRVIEYALDAVLAFHRAEMASHVELRHLYSLLCTDACSFCGEIGNFVFMPTQERCCIACLVRERDFHSIELTNPEYEILKPHQNSSFAIIHTVARVYHDSDKKFSTKRYHLAPVKTLPLGDCRPERADDPPTGPYDGGREERALHYSRRYACTAYLPVLEVRGKEAHIQTGVSCKGCDLNNIAEDLANGGNPFWVLGACGRARPDLRPFSSRVFMQHFKWCASAQEIWKAAVAANDKRGTTMAGMEGHTYNLGDLITTHSVPPETTAPSFQVQMTRPAELQAV